MYVLAWILEIKFPTNLTVIIDYGAKPWYVFIAFIQQKNDDRHLIHELAKILCGKYLHIKDLPVQYNIIIWTNFGQFANWQKINFSQFVPESFLEQIHLKMVSSVNDLELVLSAVVTDDLVLKHHAISIKSNQKDCFLRISPPAPWLPI